MISGCFKAVIIEIGFSKSSSTTGALCNCYGYLSSESKECYFNESSCSISLFISSSKSAVGAACFLWAAIAFAVSWSGSAFYSSPLTISSF